MTARIQKWGNSQGLRVPKPLLDAGHFTVGEEVEMFAEVGQLIIRPAVKPKTKLKIQDLVARMPKGYKPHEESSGPAVGKEVW
jgi:antitoxin MazE